MHASEVPHQDRVGRIVLRDARLCTNSGVTPKELPGQARERPTVRPQDVFDAPVTACAQCGERVVLERKELRGAPRERFLDQGSLLPK